MTLFIAAVVAPAAGPLIYALLHRRPRAARVVDGFVLVAVPALVAWQVLTIAWSQRSALALVAVAVGLFVPVAMERFSRVLERHTDRVALVVGLSGLVLHTGLEGAAFFPLDEVATAFAVAVLLHQVPVGLVVWWLLRPRYGVAAASSGVALLVLAPLAGYALGSEILGDAHGPGVGLYQAFVSGSLVHVVFHQGRHDHRHEGNVESHRPHP